MAVSSKKTFIFRQFFNQVVLVLCVTNPYLTRGPDWSEIVTFVNTSSDFFVRLPSTSCMIFFWFLILCRVMIYFSSIITNRWFVEIKLWFTWLSCFFSGLSAPSPHLFSLLWVCFLLCIYLLFSFFFFVSYVIVNLFPIPNVYN